MPVEVTLIVGPSNSGKSTLVRCLTGKGNDSSAHPAKSNVLDLEWGKASKAVVKTPVLQSSLNEGKFVPPNGLVGLLDNYENQHGVSKTILCISTSISARHPTAHTAQDYSNMVGSNGSINGSRHHVANIVPLSSKNGGLDSWLSGALCNLLCKHLEFKIVDHSWFVP